MTELEPNKFSKQQVSKLISLGAEKPSKLVRQAHFKNGNTVPIDKEDLSFKKGYKQIFTDKVLQPSTQPFNPWLTLE